VGFLSLSGCAVNAVEDADADANAGPSATELRHSSANADNTQP
jgi:hypothetical protein